ncbi:MAG: DUF4259 domain-containing protein [Rubripirellula sp.]|nr:DUF4259 domain-containing protein [Rubripirellula sp.]
MSSWGYKTFEDEIACDWLEDLHDSDPIAFFVKCLDLTGLDHLDFLACIGVVCSAEMLCGIKSGPRLGLPNAAARWCEQHHDLNCDFLIPRAIDALKLVLTDRSEMWVRWDDEAGQFDSWLEHQQELIEVLERFRREGTSNS